MVLQYRTETVFCWLLQSHCSACCATVLGETSLTGFAVKTGRLHVSQVWLLQKPTCAAEPPRRSSEIWLTNYRGLRTKSFQLLQCQSYRLRKWGFGEPDKPEAFFEVSCKAVSAPCSDKKYKRQNKEESVVDWLSCNLKDTLELEGSHGPKKTAEAASVPYCTFLESFEDETDIESTTENVWDVFVIIHGQKGYLRILRVWIHLTADMWCSEKNLKDLDILLRPWLRLGLRRVL